VAVALEVAVAEKEITEEPALPAEVEGAFRVPRRETTEFARARAICTAARAELLLLPLGALSGAFGGEKERGC
jgi:hypothetical protein